MIAHPVCHYNESIVWIFIFCNVCQINYNVKKGSESWSCKFSIRGMVLFGKRIHAFVVQFVAIRIEHLEVLW